MASEGYADFRINFVQVQGVAGTYGVTAQVGDGPPATSSFTIPLSLEELEQAIQQLGRSRSANRDVGVLVESQKATAEELGVKLADALLAGDVGDLYENVRQQGNVRMRIAMTDEPELMRIPWEFLCRDSIFLASQRRTPVVRELETRASTNRPVVDGKIRILGVVASPKDLGKLEVASERARVDKAVEDVADRVELHWLEPSTKTNLREVLRDESFHIVHFVGHSDFNDSQGMIYLTDDAGGHVPLTDTELVNLVADQQDLQLVVLNSCKGARTSLEDPFTGLATKLVRQGCPAVIAMQFEISDGAAITFAGELYKSLVDRQFPIDAAVAEARKAVRDDSQLEWATPVLFLRSGVSRLFEFRPPSSAPATPVAPTAPPAAAPVQADRAEPSSQPRPDPVASSAPAVVNSLASAGRPAEVSQGSLAGSDDESESGSGRSGRRRSKRKKWILGGLAVVVAVIAVLILVDQFVDEIGRDTKASVERCLEAVFEPGIGADAVADVDGGADALDERMRRCETAVALLDSDGIVDGSLYNRIQDRVDETEILLDRIDTGVATEADGAEFDHNAEQRKLTAAKLLDEIYVRD